MTTAADRTSTPLRIIALAPNDWRDEWFNRQHLLSRLAPRHRIVYSTGLWYSWEVRSEEFRRTPWLARFAEHDGVIVHERGRLPLRIPRIAAIDRLAIRRTCRSLARRVAAAPGPLIAHVFNPEFQEYVDPLGADYVVYHAYDLFRTMFGTSSGALAAEESLLRQANLVIATSPETARDLQRRGPSMPCVIGNGVDWLRFQHSTPPEEPAELAQIPHPRIGYVGTMNPKVDFDLLLELARRRPRWQFVLIGPVRNLRDEDTVVLGKLDRLPNVHRRDKIAQDRLTAYLHNIDVGMICYRLSLGWPSAGYPLKLLEYLACGIPVVSSSLETVRQFSADVAIADSADEWEAALDAAVTTGGVGTPESRRQVARENSWDSRAEQLERLLQRMVSGRAGTPRG
jgi:glycosyltransferase involved in cell wall biosynthesis